MTSKYVIDTSTMTIDQIRDLLHEKMNLLKAKNKEIRTLKQQLTNAKGSAEHFRQMNDRTEQDRKWLEQQYEPLAKIGEGIREYLKESLDGKADREYDRD